MSVMTFDPFGDPFRRLDRLTNQLVSGTKTPMGMAMDVWQTDDGYQVALDLPGVDPDSVEITSERNVLTITADRRPGYEQGARVVVAERPQGKFTRQLQVAETLDSAKIDASYALGVLTLSIPVAESAQPRRIQVQHAGDQREIDVSADGPREPVEAGAGGAGEATPA